MVGVFEIARRMSTQATHRIHSLPILVLNVHTACNCRCVMCDIWTANAQGREMSLEELERHLGAIRRMHVQRVMLTGGEPLLHRNLWRLCERLREGGIRITLVTTGLLIERHLAEIAENVDELVVSIDGPRDVHDAIRRVPGGFAKIEHGLELLANYAARPETIARSVVQRLNCAHLVQTVDAVRRLAIDRLSFLAADVTSTAFNRPSRWDEERQSEVALSADQLPLLAASIDAVRLRCQRVIESGFVVGGVEGLWRIHHYYGALLGGRDFPPTRCNAPWTSAVVEPGGTLRPCFFHQPYFSDGTRELDAALNVPTAVSFRRLLDVRTDETCKRCVCSINVAPWAEV